MADRVSASIMLGGTIAQADFAELADLIEQENLSIDWDEEPFQPDDFVSGTSLHLCAHEVAWEKFEEIEGWCEARSISFNRRSDAYGGEWNAERVVFTGSGKPRSFMANADGHIVIDRDIVDQLGLIEAIHAYFGAADFAVPPLIVRDTT